VERGEKGFFFPRAELFFADIIEDSGRGEKGNVRKGEKRGKGGRTNTA